MSAAAEPPFSLEKTRYDLSTYFGRLRHFVAMTDPRTLMYSNDTISECRIILEKYKSTGMMCGTSSDMWNYRRIVESAVHPVSLKSRLACDDDKYFLGFERNYISFFPSISHCTGEHSNCFCHAGLSGFQCTGNTDAALVEPKLQHGVQSRKQINCNSRHCKLDESLCPGGGFGMWIRVRTGKSPREGSPGPSAPSFHHSVSVHFSRCHLNHHSLVVARTMTQTGSFLFTANVSNIGFTRSGEILSGTQVYDSTGKV